MSHEGGERERNGHTPFQKWNLPFSTSLWASTIAKNLTKSAKANTVYTNMLPLYKKP